MTELDHILDVHRRESRRANDLFDLMLIVVAIVSYGAYQLIKWIV